VTSPGEVVPKISQKPIYAPRRDSVVILLSSKLEGISID